MNTPKEAANILGLSSDPKTIALIQQIQLDTYQAGLMEAQLIAADVIYKNQHDYCPADYALPREQYLSGLTFKVTSAICAKADKATVRDLRQDASPPVVRRLANKTDPYARN